MTHTTRPASFCLPMSDLTFEAELRALGAARTWQGRKQVWSIPSDKIEQADALRKAAVAHAKAAKGAASDDLAARVADRNFRARGE